MLSLTQESPWENSQWTGFLFQQFSSRKQQNLGSYSEDISENDFPTATRTHTHTNLHKPLQKKWGI